MEKMMRRYAVLWMIGLAASSAGAQQATPPAQPPASATSDPSSKAVVAMESPQAGDYWNYQVRDEITGKITATRANIVTEVSANDISVRFSIAGTSNEGLNLYDRSWNLLKSGARKYTPNDGTALPTPLTIGETWNFQGNDVNAGNGFTWSRSGRSKVVGQETVTTKAGTFETFKIETTISSRNAKDPTMKTETATVTWYAPAIDHWVKRTFVLRVDDHLRDNNTSELVEYGRKQ